MNIKKIQLIFSLILLPFFFSCENPFATREVEEPIRSRSNQEIPSDPESVIRNLQVAFSSRDVSNYMNCLTQKPNLYQFVPDELVKGNNPGLFENWNIESEQVYMNQITNFVPADSISQVTFEVISNEVFADSALLRRNYSMILNHTFQGNVPRKAEGQAYFWLFKEEGYWYIREWLDFGTNNQSSWSSIKAGFGK